MSEIFEKQLDRLVKDIRDAHMHYDIFMQIRKSISIESHRDYMNRATNFWSLTFNAHLDCTRLGLCRIYDKTKKAISINKWLREHKELLLEKASEPGIEKRHCMSAPVTLSVIETDLELTNEKNALVSSLNEQRNKAIIHSANSEIGEIETVFERYPLTFSNYDELLKRAETIVNRYSVLYSAMSHSIYTEGRNDLKNVIPSEK